MKVFFLMKTVFLNHKDRIYPLCFEFLHYI